MVGWRPWAAVLILGVALWPSAADDPAVLAGPDVNGDANAPALQVQQTSVGPPSQNASGKTPRPPAEIPFDRLKPDAIIAIDLEQGAVADTDAIWVPQRGVSAIARIDAKSNKTDPPITVPKPPCASIAVGFDSLWVPTCEGGGGDLARLSIKHGNVSATMPLPVADPQGSIATTVGSVWVVTSAKGVLSRIDPDTQQPVAEAYVAGKPSSVVAGEDALWVTSETGNVVTRINPHTNAIIETVKVGPRPGRIVVGEGAVWTLNRGDGSVSRIDAKSNKLVTTIAVGDLVASGEIAAGEGSVWISAPGVPITRIDPASNRVVQRFAGTGGGAIVVAHGSLWIAAGPKVTWRIDPKLVAAMRP